MMADVNLTAVPAVAIARAGDDPAALILDALERAEMQLVDRDVLVVASKLISRCEGRTVFPEDVVVGEEAARVAEATGKDPRQVQVVLDQSASISRMAPGVLIARHELGFVVANAAVDSSNVAEVGTWILLPVDPDASAADIKSSVDAYFGIELSVIISDSFGRPFRNGTVGAAIGCAGIAALRDRRGDVDLLGRVLEHTVTATADALAAAADLLIGQADEGTPVVRIRGAQYDLGDGGAAALIRDPDLDLYA